MINSDCARPNRFHMAHTDGGSTGQFGNLLYVHAKWHVPGNGHGEYIRIGTRGGLSMEVTREFAIALYAALPAALASRPNMVDVEGQ